MESEDGKGELNLEEITAKENDSISEPERTFLMENKSSLTEDESKKFEIEQDKPAEKETPPDPQIRVPLPTAEDKPKDTKADPDADLDLDGRQTAKEEAEKAVAPINADVQAIKDVTEVDGFIRTSPDHAKYRDTILTWMKHPSYRNVPASSIAAIVSANDQQAIGAQKEREAQKKANDTKETGSAPRPTGVTKDWKTASKEDVQAETARVLGRQGN